MMVNRCGGVCAVPSCNNRSIEANARSFFCFPRDRELCSQWVTKCRRTDLQDILNTRGPYTLSRNYKICADHFTVKDYRNPNLSSQGLRKGSVPSLRLDEPYDYSCLLKRKKLKCLIAPEPGAAQPEPLRNVEHVVLHDNQPSEDATTSKSLDADRDPLMMAMEEESSDEAVGKDDVIKKEPDDSVRGDLAVGSACTKVKADDLKWKVKTEKSESSDESQDQSCEDEDFSGAETKDSDSPREAADTEHFPPREVKSEEPDVGEDPQDPDGGDTYVNVGDFLELETKISGDAPVETNAAEVTFTCTACNLSFSSCNYMQQHIKHCRKLKATYFKPPSPEERVGAPTRHPVVENCTYRTDAGTCKKRPGYVLATCNICGKDLRNNRSLKQHMFLHRLEAGERPFACECGARFTQNCDLTKHKRQHTGEKPYVCSVCGARFTLVSNLSKHRKKHTGEKPHVCSECGATFAESGSLTRHARQHSGERPYACPDCGATFGQSSSLTRHKRKHTGERPFQCSVCGLRFTESGNLNSHRRLHTGEKPYTCEGCGQGHARLSYLKNHARNCQAVLGT